MLEDIIYQDPTILISTSRIVVGSTTYVFNNVASVKMTYSVPPNRLSSALIIIGGFILLSHFGETRGDYGEPFSGEKVFYGIALCGVGLWMRSDKMLYHVTLVSSSGESKAITSSDRAYIDAIIGHINDGIVRNHR